MLLLLKAMWTYRKRKTKADEGRRVKHEKEKE